MKINRSSNKQRGDAVDGLLFLLVIIFAAFMAFAIGYNGGRKDTRDAAVRVGVAHYVVNNQGEIGFEFIPNTVTTNK